MIRPWMIIGGVMLLVAMGSALIRPSDISWEKRLDRPRWLFFEPAIPLFWMMAFAGGAASAVLVWQDDPGTLKTWAWMGLYLLTEVVTVAYIPATLRSHHLKVGFLLGATSVILGVVLAIAAWQVSDLAAALMVPYLIWSPIGTYATRQMIRLNPEAV